jgi:membrane protease YdiL (CAAX protease family)
MKSFIRNLSAPAEFCLVILICFGLSISYSIQVIASHLMHMAPPQPHISNLLAIQSLIQKLLALVVVLCIGYIRGWSFATLGFQISWKWTGVGVLLCVFVTVASSLIHKLVHAIHAEPATFGVSVGVLSLPIIFIFSVVNPVFEETIEVGYFIRSLQRFGMWPAVLASAFFKSFLHVYQGVSGALGIFAIGVILGLAYWKWRQLWPLIVCHFLRDFIGLLFLSHLAAS